jgi:hypothetical protein
VDKIQGLDWLVKEQANEDAIAAAIAASSALMSVASDAETITGTSTELAVTPASLRAALKASAQTIATANLGTVRLIHGALTASHAAISAGNLAGTRGVVTLSGVISAGGAYLYGAQGKLVVTGTMNHADARLCAGISQLDASGGTLTAGQLSGHWIDIVGITGAGGGQFNAIRITANYAAKPASLIYGQLDASFLLDLVTPSGGAMSFVVAAGTGATSAGNAAGVATKVALIRHDGTTYYIPLFAVNAN